MTPTQIPSGATNLIDPPRIYRETGILFRRRLVRQIQSGNKTQTRRLRGLDGANKDPMPWRLHRLDVLDYMAKERDRGKFGAYLVSDAVCPGTRHIYAIPCPYGRIGDRLWVRETWLRLDSDHWTIDGKRFAYAADTEPGSD